MRTTLDITDPLLVEAKRIADEQHSSLKAVVEDALRLLISRRHSQTAQERPAWPVIDYAKPVPGIDLTKTSELLDLE
jgi:Bacterial antitoxin of type II TA system, VapB